MSDTDDTLALKPRVCISRQCRLCGFDFKPGELLVASKFFHVPGTKTGSTGKICHGHDTYDKSMELWFDTCEGFCEHHEGQAIGCHSDCVSFLSFCPPQPLLEALAFSYQPLLSAQAERQKRICWTLQEALVKSQEPKSRLPAEIWLQIATFLTREYTVATVRDAWLTRCSADCRVTLSASIWARFVSIGGVDYIANLANTPVSGHGYKKIFDAKDCLPVHQLYISEDNLGIRQIFFTHAEDQVPSHLLNPPTSNHHRLESWWRTITTPSGIIQAKTDGLKIRSIGYFNSCESLLWAAPMPSCSVRPLYGHNIAPPTADTTDNLYRMTSMQCNDHRNIGYSAYWNGRLVALYNHQKDGPIPPYNEIDENYGFPVWLYMPLSDGEQICDVWRRGGKNYECTAILFQTNQGRATILGPHTALRVLAPAWRHIAKLPSVPTPIYFNISPRSIHQLAIKQRPHNNTPFPKINLTPPPCPITYYDLFLTSATLDNVVEIIPCRQKLANHSPIIGLLLHYGNGNRACLGQFRFDCVGTPIVIDQAQNLFLGFAKKSSKYPYVAKITLDPMEKQGDYSWIEMSWRGQVDWWFTWKNCQVFYDGQASFPLYRPYRPI